MSRIDSDKLKTFLSRPRTLKEIAEHFGAKNLSPEQIRKVALPDRHALFEQQNDLGEPLFMTAEQPLPLRTVKPRIWAYRWAPRPQPYLWVQFQPHFKHPRIKLVGLSDMHYGAKSHAYDRFRRYVKWIAENDDVFAFLNGDTIENAIDGSIGGAVYESLLTPSEQIWGAPDKGEPGMIELLRPIAHKILWAQPGNHEWRTWKKTNLDPLRIICYELGIPYSDEPIFADVLAWGHRFTFYCQHGRTGSQTKGGKMNAAGRPAEFQESVDFIIMGHVHDSMGNPITRFVRRREFDGEGKLAGFWIEERAQYIVICPSFYSYFGSYGSRAGYSPGSWGTIVCTLFNDGTYRASE
ncbi:hypothetical protein AMJ57_03520 [Parcubacteria bacterium SG8_24]|nr:MAG: hypothetical protein AMJ57_03520 [Parcubacteria bacterium SG8_24]